MAFFGRDGTEITFELEWFLEELKEVREHALELKLYVLLQA